MSENVLDAMPEEVVREPVPGPNVEPAEQLAHLIPALWRTLKRAADSSGRQLPTTESQVTILRLTILNGGMTTSQLAEELHIARPTVSNLVKALVRDGLVRRRIEPHDARVVTIEPTDLGREILQTFRQDRTEALRIALADHPDYAHSIDAQALATDLRRLLGRLEAVADMRDSDEEGLSS